MSSVYLLQQVSNTVDELARDLRTFGLGLELCQLDRVCKPSRIAFCGSRSTRLSRFTLGNRIHHLLELDPECYSFGILARDQRAVKIRTREFGAQDLMLFDAELGHEAVIEADFSGYVISIQKRRLAEVAENMGLSGLESVRSGAGHLNRLPVALAETVRARLRAAVYAAGDSLVLAELEESR